MSKQQCTKPSDQNSNSPIHGHSKLKEKYNLKWYVQIDLTEDDFQHPQLMVISQGLSYYAYNNKPSLQFNPTITLQELETIVAKFPKKTPLVICYGDGQNWYRYKVIGELYPKPKKEKDYKNDQNIKKNEKDDKHDIYWEKAKSDGAKWKKDNGDLLAKLKTEGRDITLLNASEFMNMPSCETLFQQLKADYKKYQEMKSDPEQLENFKTKELNQLFEKFATTARNTLYKDLIRSREAGSDFYYGDSPDPLSLDELKDILFEASLNYLLHETAVLVELCKLKNFQHLLYKSKTTRKKSKSEALDFEKFSIDLIHYLSKYELISRDCKMQYKEFISTTNPKDIQPKSNNKSSKQMDQSTDLKIDSPTLYEFHPNGLTEKQLKALTKGNTVLKVTTTTVEYIPLPPEPQKNKVKKSITTQSTSSTVTSNQSFSCSNENFNENENDSESENGSPLKYIPQTNSPITFFNIPKLYKSPLRKEQREKIASFCCELLCEMIKSDQFTIIQCKEKIIQSPCNQTTRLKLIEATNKIDQTQDRQTIEIKLDLKSDSSNGLLSETEYGKDIQEFVFELFFFIYEKKLFDYSTALTKIAIWGLDSQYADKFIQQVKGKDEKPSPQNSMPIPQPKKQRRKPLYTSIGSFPPTKYQLESKPNNSKPKSASSNELNISKTATVIRSTSFTNSNNDNS